MFDFAYDGLHEMLNKNFLSDNVGTLPSELPEMWNSYLY